MLSGFSRVFQGFSKSFRSVPMSFSGVTFALQWVSGVSGGFGRSKDLRGVPVCFRYIAGDFKGVPVAF